MTFEKYYTSTFVDNHHSSLSLYTYVHSSTPCFADLTQPLIILLHGAGGDHRQFDTVFPALIKKGHPVMVTDLRYHGRSQPKDIHAHVIDPIFDFNDILADLDQALLWYQKQHHHNNNTTVIIGGLSMGGMIAQLYAQHLMLSTINKSPLLSSIKVHALIGIGCAQIMITEPTIPWMSFYKTATYSDVQEMIPAARLSIIDSAHKVIGKQISRSELCLVDDKVLFSCFRACSNVPSLPDKNNVLLSIPQLLLRGEYDTHTEDVMDAWYTRFKDIPSNVTIYNTIPDAGHIATVDNGNIVSQNIITFLSSQS